MQINLLTLQLQFMTAVLLALILRQCMKRIPKIYSYVLWILVFGRLLCPFSFEMKHAVMPDAGRVNQLVEQVSGEFVPVAAMQQDVSRVEDILREDATPEKERWTVGELRQVVSAVFPVLWCVGTVLIIGINVLALLGIYRKICGAVLTEQNVFVSEKLTTPFTFGVLRPQIFLPAGMSDTDRRYVLCHERVHISRKDYLVKGIAFLLTALFWFNPFVWVAFHFLEQDMEMSCDEAVIRRLGNEVRRQYSQSLLDFAAGKKRRAYVPLAFGEVSVKQRIKNVLSKKNTKRYISCAGILALCAVTVVIFTAGGGNSLAASDGEDQMQAGARGDDRELLADGGMTASVRAETNRTVGAKDPMNTGTAASAGDDSPKGAASPDESDSPTSVEAGGMTEQTKAQVFLSEWAMSFCGRDGNYIAAHSSASVQRGLMEKELLSQEQGTYSFGMSSPWPWGESDYRIRNLDENQASILYYAQTSDPHMTVWLEQITFEETERGFLVTKEELLYMDDISSHYEFCMAYPAGEIAGTPMDYETNGLLDGLLLLAGASAQHRKMLGQPEEAAVFLLNLSNDKKKVEVTAEERGGRTVATIYFAEEQKTYEIDMVHPADKRAADLWVPQGHDRGEEKENNE